MGDGKIMHSVSHPMFQANTQKQLCPLPTGQWPDLGHSSRANVYVYRISNPIYSPWDQNKTTPIMPTSNFSEDTLVDLESFIMPSRKTEKVKVKIIGSRQGMPSICDEVESF